METGMELSSLHHAQIQMLRIRQTKPHAYSSSVQVSKTCILQICDRKVSLFELTGRKNQDQSNFLFDFGLSSPSVIAHLRAIFEECGIPEIIQSDNGSQYSSSEFRRFAKQYGFKHITSSPHFAQSNGFIE